MAFRQVYVRKELCPRVILKRLSVSLTHPYHCKKCPQRFHKFYLSYHQNSNNLPEIDHINRDSLDNRLENLRWVDKFTQSVNRTGFGKYAKYIYLEDCKTKKNPNPSWKIQIRNYKCKYCKRYSGNKYSLEEIKEFRNIILNDNNIEIID